MSGLGERLEGRAPQLSVGVLTADLLRLGEDLEMLEGEGVDFVHIDVMDGVFCPQITVGPQFVNAVPDHFVKDVHLMIEDPLAKVDAFVAAGADVLTFHIEASRHPHRILQSLAGSGVARGVALNPGTPIEAVEPLLDDLEIILVLAVNPGWSGQRFVATTSRRLAKLGGMIEGSDIVLAVDGGITRENVAALAEQGVDLIVTGSAIFDGNAPAENLRQMRRRMAEGSAASTPLEDVAAVRD